MTIKQALVTAVVSLMVITVGGCATTSRNGQGLENPQEKEIFIQAIATGAVIGGTIGAVVGNQMADKDKDKDKDKAKRTQMTILGGALGAVVGTTIGRGVAEIQLMNYRDLRLESDKLQELLKSAGDYNQQVARYNKTLKGEIASLERQSEAQRADLAKVNRAAAEKQRQAVVAQLKQRNDLAAKLEQQQQAKYRETIKSLQNKKKQLDASIARLESIEEQARVGR